MLGAIPDNSPGFVRWPGVGEFRGLANLRPPVPEVMSDLKSNFATHARSLYQSVQLQHVGAGHCSNVEQVFAIAKKPKSLHDPNLMPDPLQRSGCSKFLFLRGMTAKSDDQQWPQEQIRSRMLAVAWFF